MPISFLKRLTLIYRLSTAYGLMKALVTGGTGFIGSALVEELGILGFDVFVLMRRSSSSANLEGLKYQRVEGDLSDVHSLRKAVRDVDYVFHLAGVVSASKKQEFYDFNTRATSHLAEAVAELRPGLNRFVYVSSLAAGGPSSSLQPRSEIEKDDPVSDYGQSKLRAERELLQFKDYYPISIVRPPLVYGPRDRATFVFVQTVSRNVIPIFQGSNGGQKYYSSIHVRDLVRGIVQAGVAPMSKVPSGEIFYMSSDGHTTYENLMHTIAEQLNLSPLKIKVPRIALTVTAAGLTAIGRLTRKKFPLNWDKLNEIRPDYWICSNHKAKKQLGFSPEFDLATGMADAIQWYQRQKWI